MDFTMKSSRKAAQQQVGRTNAMTRKPKAFTEEERDAMKERIQELRGEESEGESVVLAKLNGMPGLDRAMGKRVHTIVKASAPELTPRLWYGMPAYAKEDKVVLFFQPASKFKSRYATLGFSDKAKLDDGPVWPVVFALKELTPAAEERIAELVKKAVS